MADSPAHVAVPAAPADSTPAAGNAFRPCFIVGCERSGTTLLAVMLDRHSRMTITPETHFLINVVPRRHKRWLAPRDHEGMLRRLDRVPRLADLELDHAQLATRFQTYPASFANLLRAMLEEYALLRGKPLVGEKTPFHLWRVPQILRWYPEARIINIIRDGRDVCLSSRKTNWTRRRNLRVLAFRWVRCVRTARTYERQFPGNFLSLRYEDLLRQPEEVLRKVDAFVGLPFEEGQICPQGESRTVPQWEQGWKGNALKSLDPSRIGAWKKQVSQREWLIMNQMMGAELKREGYGDLDLPPLPTIQVLGNRFLNMLCRCGIYRLAYNCIGRFLPAPPPPPPSESPQKSSQS